jgi:Domain of unknown function (DUF4338)
LKLQEVSITIRSYQEIRNRHYVANNGCIGRQIHYLIFQNGNEFGERAIGIISGASPVFMCKPRDEFFGISNTNRIQKLDQIINNTVFRLEYNEPNLASKILAMWRKQIIKDWQERYKIKPVGFETFVFGQSRTGITYKADNWRYVGITKGNKRLAKGGKVSLGTQKIMREPTEKKLIFCKSIL